MAYRPEFADAVRDALAGRPYRQIAAKAGMSASYIADLVQGHVPAREKVISFASATGYDENRLLVAAGYEPNEESGAEWFVRELARLRLKHGRPIPVDLSDGMESLSIEQAREVVAQIETHLQEGKI